MHKENKPKPSRVLPNARLIRKGTSGGGCYLGEASRKASEAAKQDEAALVATQLNFKSTTSMSLPRHNMCHIDFKSASDHLSSSSSSGGDRGMHSGRGTSFLGRLFVCHVHSAQLIVKCHHQVRRWRQRRPRLYPIHEILKGATAKLPKIKKNCRKWILLAHLDWIMMVGFQLVGPWTKPQRVPVGTSTGVYDETKVDGIGLVAHARGIVRMKGING